MIITRKDAELMAMAYEVACSAIEDVDVEDGVFDHTITDPPYLPRTQDNTRRGHASRTGISEAMPLGFDALTATKRRAWAQKIAIATSRWALVFSDHEGSMAWADDLERAGMDYIRSAIWVRTGDQDLDQVVGRPTQSGAPQFTGDRPAVGHEVIVIAHARGKALRWNGHGKQAVYVAPVVPSIQRAHSTEKPLSLMRELAIDFVDAGDRVWDPFAGAGTTLVACKLRGAHCAGIELSSKFATFAARRAAAASASQLSDAAPRTT